MEYVWTREFCPIIKNNEIICRKMDRTGGNYVKLNKVDLEWQIHVFFHMYNMDFSSFVCMYVHGGYESGEEP